MTRIGISLDLLLSSSLMISNSSVVEQSLRNIEFLFEGKRNSSKELNFESERFTIDSFSFEAIELKYLLNSLAIILLSVIFLLSITIMGLITFLDFPLSSLIICQTFGHGHGQNF